MANLNFFKVILLVQLFYAFSITGIVYFMPPDTIDYVTSFSDITEDIDLETIGEDMQGSLEQQTNIPLIEVGALVFYSSNILIDLLLNFILAIPQMLTLLINGILLIFSIDTQIVYILQLFISVVMLILYVLYVMEILLSFRSGGGVL